MIAAFKIRNVKVSCHAFSCHYVSCHESHFDVKQYCSENRVLSLGMKANEDLEPLQVVLSVLI